MPLPIGLSNNAPPPIMRFVSHAKKYIFSDPKKEWECIIENTVQKNEVRADHGNVKGTDPP